MAARMTQEDCQQDRRKLKISEEKNAEVVRWWDYRPEFGRFGIPGAC
jgi:hypothetical protein